MDKQEKIKFCQRLGANISQIRKSKGITLEKLAYEMGLSKGNLSEIENGLVDPRSSTLFLIAEGLEIPLSKLFSNLSLD